MTLMNRLARLWRADAHAVLDRLEDPRTLLDGAVRDMEVALAADAADLERHHQRLARLEAQAGMLQAQRAAATGELEVCLDAGEDDLARAVIKRRLQIEARLEDLDQGIEDARAQVAGLDAQMAQRGDALAAIREKRSLYRHEDGAVVATGCAIPADRIEVVLLREKQRRAS